MDKRPVVNVDFKAIEERVLRTYTEAPKPFDWYQLRDRIMAMPLSDNPDERRLQKQARFGFAYGVGPDQTRAFLDHASILISRRRARRNARLAIALGFIALVLLFVWEIYSAH